MAGGVLQRIELCFSIKFSMGRTAEAWADWVSPRWSAFLRARLSEIARKSGGTRDDALHALGSELAGMSSKQRAVYMGRVLKWSHGETATFSSAFRVGQALGKLGARSSGLVAAFAAGRVREVADFILRLADDPTDRAAVFHAVTLFFWLPFAIDGNKEQREEALSVLDRLARRGGPDEDRPHGANVGLCQYESVFNKKKWDFNDVSARACSTALLHMPPLRGSEAVWGVIYYPIAALANAAGGATADTWNTNVRKRTHVQKDQG